MPNYNHCTFAGHLGRDPELRIVGETSVASFSLAVTDRFKGRDGETKEDTMWIDCECWGKQAELANQYLTKGSPVLVAGKLKLDQWEDKKDGTKRSRHRLWVDTLQFLWSKSRDGAERQPADTPRPTLQQRAEAAGGDDNQPPF